MCFHVSGTTDLTTVCMEVTVKVQKKKVSLFCMEIEVSTMMTSSLHSRHSMKWYVIFHLKTISSSLCTILFNLSSWIQCTLYVGEFHKYFWSKLRKLWRRCMKIVSLSIWGPTTDTKCSCIFTWSLHLGGLHLEQAFLKHFKWRMLPLLLKLGQKKKILIRFPSNALKLRSEVLEIYLKSPFVLFLLVCLFFPSFWLQQGELMILTFEFTLVICWRTVVFTITSF